MMLQEIIDTKQYSFQDGFDSWEEAIRQACAPLVNSGAVKPEYAEHIIGNVHEFGPYIVIAPDVCIPHAQEGRGVNTTTVGFMRCKTPVDFGPDAEYTARLFFVLASTDNEKHLGNLAKLVEMLDDEATTEALIAADTVEDLQAIANKAG